VTASRINTSIFMTPKSSKPKVETNTAEAPQQLDLSLPPLPDDALEQILRKLYGLAQEGNTTAAKLFVDLLKTNSNDAPALLTVEDALKIIQDRWQGEKIPHSLSPADREIAKRVGDGGEI
jgi:hypothetical protein